MATPPTDKNDTTTQDAQAVTKQPDTTEQATQATEEQTTFGELHFPETE